MGSAFLDVFEQALGARGPALRNREVTAQRAVVVGKPGRHPGGGDVIAGLAKAAIGALARRERQVRPAGPARHVSHGGVRVGPGLPFGDMLEVSERLLPGAVRRAC